MQSEMSSAASQVFRQLNDADMRFGTVKDADGHCPRTEPLDALVVVAI